MVSRTQQQASLSASLGGDRQRPCQTDIETPPVVACKPCLLTRYFFYFLLLSTAATLGAEPANAPRAVRFPDTWAKPTAEP